MARTSIAAAKAELFGLLNGNVSGATGYFDHEPHRGSLLRPVSLTVSTGGMDSENYRLFVKIWQDAGRDPKGDQDQLDGVILATDLLIRDGFVVEDWSAPEFDEEASVLVVTGTVTCGREDDLYQ